MNEYTILLENIDGQTISKRIYAFSYDEAEDEGAEYCRQMNDKYGDGTYAFVVYRTATGLRSDDLPVAEGTKFKKWIESAKV